MPKNLFNSVKMTKPKRNHFDLSHDVKLTMNMGDLVPIMVQECVPGDTFHLQGQSLIRMAPLLAPVMHRIDVSMHYFFVPNRILWRNFTRWVTKNRRPGDVQPEPTVAYASLVTNNYDNPDQKKLLDYMGFNRPNANGVQTISPLALAAYQKIYDEYYRDQNLSDTNENSYTIADGNNTANLSNLLQFRKRAWGHDYFTSCLPWAQKGEQVSIPVANADTEVFRNRVPGIQPVEEWDTRNTGVGAPTPDTQRVRDSQAGNPDIAADRLFTKGGAVASSINDLRKAYRLQEWLEKNARSGTRYVESVFAHFGVRSSDARLQRPEYICGTKSPLIISEVLNTTGMQGQLPQGNMAGHGLSVSSGKLGSFFCEEHGFIIGIMSIVPLTAYQQGLPRMYGQRFDRMDYYWPEFAHLGEQDVKIKELYAEAADPEKVFGYLPRYAEYKFNPSRTHGDFKTSLGYWTLTRRFANEPQLNMSFVECNPSTDIFAVTDPTVDHFYVQVLNMVSAKRPMPKYGTPTF